MHAIVYTPEGAGPFSVVLYLHGGGWVFADRKVYDGGARGLSKQANAVVVSVDYRLAPENKFPAAHEDALAAYPSLNGSGMPSGIVSMIRVLSCRRSCRHLHTLAGHSCRRAQCYRIGARAATDREC
jgi:hypothetical protein